MALRTLLDGVDLRTKLLLVTLALLAIPLVGISYVREMEAFLREGQRQGVIALARAAATGLNDRPALLDMRANPPDVEPPLPLAELISPDQPSDPIPAPPSTDTPVTAGMMETAIPQSGASDRRVTPQAIREIDQIVQGLARSESRIWVVDRDRRLLALTGSLRPTPGSIEAQPAHGLWGLIESRLLRPIFTVLLQPPSTDFEDALPESVLSSGKDVDSALAGIAASRWRNTTDDRVVIVSAAHPIWSGEEVIAAVVAEQTTLPVLSVRHRAFERLLTVTLAAFVLGAGSLFWFASRLSRRLRDLRDEAESAIDAQGRVRRLVQGSTARDEIGDLSRSFSTVLERLAQYNTYLERMADRLSHELRTPVAVVSSSLDNLKQQRLPADAEPYINRAETGLRRLNTILTRMREATRLEQMLREAERERFDLCEVVSGCVAGYRGAFPRHRFELKLPGTPVWLDGSPDLIAQMLDKIVDNATDFAPEGDPIEVRIDMVDGRRVLAVSNVGPLLPEEMQGQLFESMISVRGAGDGRRDAPHLGLGLFLVRLIAEFHHAQASARNREDGRGVVVEVVFGTHS